MAEYSFPWTDNLGDGGPYAAGTWDDIYEALFTSDATKEAVLRGLAVSGTASPVSVAAGSAVVKGKIYRNTAALDVSVPTPTSQARYDRIVLQADWSTQTVRVVRLAGTEGSGSPPTLTQTDGVKWEISLAKLYVTTGGAITVTDERVFARYGGEAHLRGQIIMWSGTLSGHYPVDPRSGVADTRWHICNGDVENGVQTPNLQDRFVICAGSTYSAGATGGSATKNLAHTHGVGTLAAANESSHTHAVNITSEAVQAGLHNHSISSVSHFNILQGQIAQSPPVYGLLNMTNHNHGGLTGSSNPTAHSHNVSGSTGAGSAHTHPLSGSTAAGGSATQDIMPPYYAMVFLCYVGS